MARHLLYLLTMNHTRRSTQDKGVETMQIIRKTVGTMALMAALVACGQGGRVAQTTAAVQSADEAAALAFLNDQQLTTFDLLDTDCGLRSDSAQQIIKYRDGLDNTPGTADDNLFDTIAELDTVHRVGQWTIDQVKACADSFGYTPTPYELAVVNFLNDASTDLARLDLDCALRSDAAANLIAHRDANPFHSLEEVDSVSQVGPVTLDLIAQCASHFGFADSEPLPDPQQCDPAPWDGTYDQEIYYWNASQVSPDVAGILPDLQAAAESSRDRSVTFPVRFGEIYQYSLNGEVVHTQISFVQTIDPEGGIQLWFYYQLDSCLNITDTMIGI
jgi:hypothetical protein